MKTSIKYSVVLAAILSASQFALADSVAKIDEDTISLPQRNLVF